MTSSSNGVGNAQTIASHPRHAYTRAILGEELFTRLSSAKVLVVGAGGIGCELLKTLALVGVGNIEVIDLDTIDLSNLNRQFLFTKAHISKPKSLIASTTARSFNPLVHITPFHANVKDTTQFGWEYFLKFDVVCNALDNLEARRWVNRMCIMTGVPLVESGTTGFLGQVQPIMKVSTFVIQHTSASS
jgi:ubiquitin-like 1-activating enzyme E1 B